jgi:uncharacterized circularly permuted ATP-grasp superfamily protein
MYRPEMRGIDLPNRVYAHIAGIDLVRVAEQMISMCWKIT